jgi:hypothetical protein
MANTTQKSRAKTTTASRAKAAPSRPPRRRSTASSANGASASASDRSTASKLRGPALAGGAAIAGILGGVALGAKAMPRKRRFPSVNGLGKVDLKKVDVKKTRKQVGRASKAFGEFTKELRKAGEQAERIGNALS